MQNFFAPQLFSLHWRPWLSGRYAFWSQNCFSKCYHVRTFLTLPFAIRCSSILAIRYLTVRPTSILYPTYWAVSTCQSFRQNDSCVKAGSHLGLSFRERTLFLSFYVLSLPHYHHSILLLHNSIWTRTIVFFVSFSANALGSNPNNSLVLFHTLNLAFYIARVYSCTPLS